MNSLGSSFIIRHENRPDFKKVEASMRTYHYSLSNKVNLEVEAAAAAVASESNK